MPIVSKFWWTAAAAALVIGPLASAEPAVNEYDVVELATGVYGVVWKETLRNPVEGNSLIIVNDDDVVVVDTMMLPSSARRLAAEVRRLTPKPVTFVVNTHWHDDHHFGNDVFRQLWPKVQIVAHRDARTDMHEQSHLKRPEVLAGYRASIDKIRGWLERGVDDAGKGFDAARRQRGEDLIALYEQLIRERNDIKEALPDVTLEQALVLHRGQRTIEVRWLGRGNTRGDVVVYLPKERLVATGDLLVHPSPFGFGSYYREWADTLGAIDRLDADMLVLGHGPVQRDRAYLRSIQSMLRDLVARVDAAVKEGATLEATQERVDLADWKQRLSGGDATVAGAFDSFFVEPAVERAWRQARGEPDRVVGVE